MLIVKSILVVLALVLLAAIAVGQAGLLKGKVPAHIGVREGRLQPPSVTPNSVSSQAALYPQHPQREYATIDPLKLRGSGAATLATIKGVVETMPGARVIRSEPNYLYVQFTTRVMGFVDDGEFWFDPVAHVIQVRSASRLGNKDFGANRSRIEALRRLLAAL
ncbi:MAG: DUF1499 domain-containing protein [Caldimonas sp.]